MRKLILEPTSKTPKVVFDTDAYEFEISGRSVPEDSVGFYRRIFNWLEQFGEQLNGEVVFKLKLEYFNTSSSKCLLDFLKILANLYVTNNKIRVEWYCEDGDDDMIESGNDFKEIAKVPIEIIVE